MYERLLKETERYLEHRKEIVVSVKHVWDSMVKQGRANNFQVPSLIADFECLLEGDRRFEFVTEKGSRKGIEFNIEEFLEHEELGKLGFSDGQKVKLRRIPLPVADDDESFDALDSAISMEELDEELVSPALFDAGEAVPTGEPARPSLTKKGSVKAPPPSAQKNGKKSKKKSAALSAKKKKK